MTRRSAARHGLPAALATVVLAAIALAPSAALAHEERPVRFPAPPGYVPTYRTDGPYLVVCKPDTLQRIAGYPEPLKSYNEQLYAECADHGFEDIQAAVDAVTERYTRILVQPGVYHEEPSLAPLSRHCQTVEERYFPLSYRQQLDCPHIQNIISILGDSADQGILCDGPLCDLQVEGTGRSPHDVVIDGQYKKLNVIRADRADGIYFRNFTVERSTFNSLYVIQTDGFVIDRVLARWNTEYGFLTFASDHGLYTDCEAYGNGDSGIYPGSASDLAEGRPAIEIQRCRSHHNLLGLSGTSGNNLYVHDNLFYDNTTGASMDSVFPNHPGLPQNSSTYEHNLVFSNNEDFYPYVRDGTCSKPERERGYEHGVVCPSVGVPVGVGFFLAGGNDNAYEHNWIFDNWRYGTMLFWVPAEVRGDNDPADQYDTSHFNRYVSNSMGITAGGATLPNGLDFWWDEEGEGNCWDSNVSSYGDPTSDPPRPILPNCTEPNPFRPGNQAKLAYLADCGLLAASDYNADECDWYEQPPPPQG